MFRKNIYKWHRRASLVIAIPVILWAASGFMHPLMTTIRPAIATQFLPAARVDSSVIKVKLSEILLRNGVNNFHNYRLIHIDTNWFYQVKADPVSVPLYFSTTNGKLLNNGDRLYGQYLAKQFLEGPDSSFQKLQPEGNTAIPLPLQTGISLGNNSSYDCCEAATACVMLNKKGSGVTSINMISDFTDEYRDVNRYLPVYRVSFNRNDGIRVYVETSGDRFAYAVDNKRAFFDKIFSLFHTWEWMNALDNTKYFFMIGLLSIAFLTTLAGLYIFFTTKAKKPSGNTLLKARRNHRWISVTASLFTLLFTFSGSYHALEKFKIDDRDKYFTRQQVKATMADVDMMRLKQVVQLPVTNISIVQIKDAWYWRVTTSGAVRKDLMTDRSAVSSPVTYINTMDYSVLPAGEEQYARQLASEFSGQPREAIIGAEVVNRFGEEYGFINKRLPVWKISYASNHNERYYVETSSGHLSVRIDDRDLYEGYSFAFFHKHHFMDWAGKTVRDISTMFWALMQIVMVMFGLILWRRKIMAARNPLRSRPVS